MMGGGWQNCFAFRHRLGGGVRGLKVFLLLFLQKKKGLLWFSVR